MIDYFPITAILGARQVGKSTMARELDWNHFFDMENPADARLLENPQLALENLQGLIVIDEVQWVQNLFPYLWYLVDQKKQQKFLLLGSASGNLINQSSESLAGRIAYLTLSGFSREDLTSEQKKMHWIRGGFPSSLLAPDDGTSYQWRENYVRTYLERDLPQLGIQIPAGTLRRFWLMLSHYHGSVINYAEISRSLGISDKMIRYYLDILSQSFMVRIVEPWFINTSKRIVKSPKIYLRDSGIFHYLQSIHSKENLLVNPKLGASWEGYVLEEARKIIQQEEIFFWATHAGAELDMFWQWKGRNFGLEVKFADAPGMTKSLHSAMEDLKLDFCWIVYPGEKSYLVHEKVKVLPLEQLAQIATPDY